MRCSSRWSSAPSCSSRSTFRPARWKRTLLVGDYLFVEKFAYGYSRYSFPVRASARFRGRVLRIGPQRGDVIVFKMPTRSPDTERLHQARDRPAGRPRPDDRRPALHQRQGRCRACAWRTISRPMDGDRPHHVAAAIARRCPNGKSYLRARPHSRRHRATTRGVFVVPAGPLLHDGRQPRQFRRQPRAMWAMFRPPRTSSARPNSFSSPPMAARSLGILEVAVGDPLQPDVHASLTDHRAFSQLGHAFKDTRSARRVR